MPRPFSERVNMHLQIQLPTSTGQLITQAIEAFEFTKNFDPRHPGPAAAFPEFLETFDKERELKRLLVLTGFLANGANVGIQIDREIVAAFGGLK